MSLATRSASYAPSTPIFHDRVEKHCPATAPAASNNLHDLEEEDLEDIDGTTLNHPPPDDSVSSGSDSDPGSDGVREEPVTPSKSTQTRLETRSQHRSTLYLICKGTPRGRLGRKVTVVLTYAQILH